ncbi:multinuclear non-heme iron-dependent oxidative enzyme ApyH [Burkholderia pseudomallei]|uniref:multinuclear non-heme iron-dependent oxidative enzyme ApyH n=1 Tax=Burkholderia pseudomallei TaxID=28450 RepID=UPI000717ECA8|nr:DUF692 family multinuclear iron-containing protein [Burkholderia pseudomallei]MBO7829318.1 DUF692 family protein [Burkholderia pseudomallei]MBO7932385.1 DUF692 family protein [Burkholderia pseudomallei]
MKAFDRDAGAPRIGLAYGPGMAEFAARHAHLVDYIEVPFELLRFSPMIAELQQTIPFVLHCASLSVAGFVPPDDSTVDAIERTAVRTGTPWIGEHLAYISADPIGEALGGTHEPTSLSYTLCPQLSDETVRRVADNLAVLAPRFPVPLIVENSPQYFSIPGSTMGMTDFIRAIADRCDVGLLLDLSHFLITAYNTGADVHREFARLPLERVVEVHLSGMSIQSGAAWDDHSLPASPILFELLERLLAVARPRALTFEYNWSPYFPLSVLTSHIERARALMGLA